jgi:hypothetical protein
VHINKIDKILSSNIPEERRILEEKKEVPIEKLDEKEIIQEWNA